MTKTLTIYVLLSFHVFMEENALNLVMLCDMHMQLCHCYCYSFVVENMKLALLTFVILMRKRITNYIHFSTLPPVLKVLMIMICLTIKTFFRDHSFFLTTDMFHRTVSL